MPEPTTDDFFQFNSFVLDKWSKKNSQQVQVELNQECGSLNYIILGSTAASIKMFSKAFKHWCFSNLSCLKPSLKTQLLTGPLNWKRFRTVKPRTQLSPWVIRAGLEMLHVELRNCGQTIKISWKVLCLLLLDCSWFRVLDMSKLTKRGANEPQMRAVSHGVYLDLLPKSLKSMLPDVAWLPVCTIWCVKDVCLHLLESYTTWLQGSASFKYRLLGWAVSFLNEKGKT